MRWPDGKTSLKARSKPIAAIMKILPEPLALGMVAGRSRSFRAE